MEIARDVVGSAYAGEIAKSRRMAIGTKCCITGSHPLYFMLFSFMWEGAASPAIISSLTALTS